MSSLSPFEGDRSQGKYSPQRAWVVWCNFVKKEIHPFLVAACEVRFVVVVWENYARGYKLTICRVILQRLAGWLGLCQYLLTSNWEWRPKRKFHLDGDKIRESLSGLWMGIPEILQKPWREPMRDVNLLPSLLLCRYRATEQSILVIDVIPKNRFTVICNECHFHPFPAASSGQAVVLMPFLHLLLLLMHCPPCAWMAWLLINFKSLLPRTTWEAL